MEKFWYYIVKKFAYWGDFAVFFITLLVPLVFQEFLKIVQAAISAIKQYRMEYNQD